MSDPTPSTPWQRALVTGASAGIGRAFAERLAADGVDLVIVARRGDRLDELARTLGRSGGRAVEVEEIVADLATPAGVATVAARLAADDRPVDLLVNNAGVGRMGPAVDGDPATETAMVAVNVAALHQLSLAAARGMAARGRGAIVNVSSVAGFLTTPRTATYGATKAFVTSFSTSLAAELADRGVTVTCLCPGLTRSEFHDRAGYDTTAYPGWAWQSPAAVAAAGLLGAAGGKVTVIPGAHNRALVGLANLVPTRLRRRVEVLVDRSERR
ncbi:MAG: SDR family NAD(P)-dependent oxidoreductase [Acidimicrobiales bacterium]